ncbi:Tetratricopeptide repeat protein OS=Streptomyces cyaneofuscatus OX=66883 GN=G3I52_07675 PE=4 SV=1 [Streptomyces cyaneofuscatus]
MARQRLRGLVSSYPHEPAPRRRLAEVYRLYGDPAEAGRWMYLEEDRSPEETAAFEERYANAVRRMRAMAWRGTESDAPTPCPARQLTAVREAASEIVGRPVTWDGLVEVKGDARQISPLTDALTGIGCLLLTIAFLGIWVYGLVSLFD